MVGLGKPQTQGRAPLASQINTLSDKERPVKRTPSTDNQAEIAARFALHGHDDPTIARTLECSVSHVRALRKEYDIGPGETRWLTASLPPEASDLPEAGPAR